MTISVTKAMAEDFDRGLSGSGFAAKPEHQLQRALDEMFRSMSATDRLKLAVAVLEYGITDPKTEPRPKTMILGGPLHGQTTEHPEVMFRFVEPIVAERKTAASIGGTPWPIKTVVHIYRRRIFFMPGSVENLSQKRREFFVLEELAESEAVSMAREVDHG